jgi:hypothetical protein
MEEPLRVPRNSVSARGFVRLDGLSSVLGFAVDVHTKLILVIKRLL